MHDHFIMLATPAERWRAIMVTLNNTEATTAHTNNLGARVKRFVPAVKGIFKAAAHRRALMASLAQADAHVLKDIGITPQDVQIACSGYWWEDPTGRLAKYAQERQQARFADPLQIAGATKNNVAA
jgi:uncharacterized protein YjiS (DUF1127 family)